MNKLKQPRDFKYNNEWMNTNPLSGVFHFLRTFEFEYSIVTCLSNFMATHHLKIEGKSISGQIQIEGN